MKKWMLLGLILRGGLIFGQKTTDAPTFAESITVADLTRHLTVLTSDSLQGRETGTEGNVKAAYYIAAQFEKMGLPKIGKAGDYFQKMVYSNEGWTTIDLAVNEQKYRHLFNFYAFPATNPTLEGKVIEAKEVIFLGFGIDDAAYSDYKKADVKGKVIMINMGEPVTGDSISLITGTKKMSDWDINKRLKTAYAKGVKAVLIVDSDLSKNVQTFRRQFNRNVMGEVENVAGVYPNAVYISPEVAKEIIGKKAKDVQKAREKSLKKKQGQPVTLSCTLKLTLDKFLKQLISNNIMGFIEGTDPDLKDEIVIVSAHYDHLGMRGQDIYRGADDNGSGTSTVLEIAEALTTAKKAGKGPRRSVLILFVTGEEKGLLGSRYYAANPHFPLDKTVVDVNIDMVGRVDDRYKDNPNYIYVIGSDKLSSELHAINEKMNADYTKLILDYKYNDEKDPNRYYYRSDHYSFAEKGIPAIFYFNGTHDDYHRPSDTIEKILFGKMRTIAQLAFYTTWEVANRDGRLKVDSNKK